MEANALLQKPSLVEQDGKHLIFQLAGSAYGIPVLNVSEINGLMNITPVPKTPEFIKGVINLRGKIIPVMDLRLKFGMPEKEYDEQTCIIIVNIPVGKTQEQMGVIVDVVSEVFNIPLTEIDPPPEYGSQDNEDFLNGIGKVKGSLVILLNVEKVLHSKEMVKLILDNKKSANKIEKGE